MRWVRLEPNDVTCQWLTCSDIASERRTSATSLRATPSRQEHSRIPLSSKTTISTICRVRLAAEYGLSLLTIGPEPLFLSCSEVDHTFPTDSRNKAIDILQKAGKPYQLQVFSGVEHGFALRCNLDSKYEREYTNGLYQETWLTSLTP